MNEAEKELRSDQKIYGIVSAQIDILDREDAYSRAMCAKLRRAVGKSPGQIPEIWDVTLKGMPTDWQSRDGNPSYAEWSIHTALTLYAMHRQAKDRSMNFKGVSFGAAAARLVQGDDDRKSVTQRFNAVATAMDFTEIAYHARGLVQLFKANDIGMDYPQFACDLYNSQFVGGADRVRLKWGEDFYRTDKIEQAEINREESKSNTESNSKIEGSD